MVVCLSIKE